MSEEQSAGGLPTFGERDWVPTLAELCARRPDAAMLGAPFDVSTTYRPGARFGPRALRAAAYHPGSYHLDLGIDIFEWIDLVDTGDASSPARSAAATSCRSGCAGTGPRRMCSPGCGSRR